MFSEVKPFSEHTPIFHTHKYRYLCVWDHTSWVHTTLYGSAAGCRSIQKRCAFWKHGLTSKNILSHLTYFCKSNINQIFTNGGGMIWGVRIAIFTEIRHLVEELITFLSIFGPQKLDILTARLNKSLSISTSMQVQWEGISVLKHAQSLHSYWENNSFWKTLWWDMWAMMHASKVSWIGITVCGRACEQWCKVTWIGIIVFCNRMEDMPLYHIFKLIILLFYSALSPMFSTNVVCVKTQQKHARIKHHDRTKQW